MALEVLGVLVGFHVRAQVGSVSEPLAALVAAEGFLASVEARVVLQQPGAREGLGTNFAFEVANVGLEVHGQGWHAHVQLVADVASLGSLWRKLPVGLLVPKVEVGRVLPCHCTFAAAEGGVDSQPPVGATPAVSVS